MANAGVALPAALLDARPRARILGFGARRPHVDLGPGQRNAADLVQHRFLLWEGLLLEHPAQFWWPARLHGRPPLDPKRLRRSAEALACAGARSRHHHGRHLDELHRLRLHALARLGPRGRGGAARLGRALRCAALRRTAVGGGRRGLAAAVRRGLRRGRPAAERAAGHAARAGAAGRRGAEARGPHRRRLAFAARPRRRPAHRPGRRPAARRGGPDAALRPRRRGARGADRRLRPAPRGLPARGRRGGRRLGPGRGARLARGAPGPGGAARHGRELPARRLAVPSEVLGGDGGGAEVAGLQREEPGHALGPERRDQRLRHQDLGRPRGLLLRAALGAVPEASPGGPGKGGRVQRDGLQRGGAAHGGAALAERHRQLPQPGSGQCRGHFFAARAQVRQQR
mmetsp:Transcript_29613/g.92500  ORF Transcript_29613/g.92500 Transcript_29613/m.92500 type:complete len:400 (+) Transcript_29613:1117-2316(+)